MKVGASGILLVFRGWGGNLVSACVCFIVSGCRNNFCYGGMGISVHMNRKTSWILNYIGIRVTTKYYGTLYVKV